jgi:thiol:disulfide interchange protein
MSRRTYPAFALVILLSILAGCGTGGPSSPTAGGGDDKWADHTQGLPFVVGYEAGMAKAQAEKKPAMLFVTTTWCGWCKKLAADDLTDPDVRKLLELFVLVIVDGDAEGDAVAKLGVSSFPRVLFQNVDGTTIADVSGYAPGQFRAQLEQAVARLGTAHGA